MKLILLLAFAYLLSCNQQNNMSKNTASVTTDLFKIVKSNDVVALKNLLSQKPNLNIKDSKERTPLMLACYLNHIDIGLALIDAGADVNQQDDILNSPFLYAGAEGQLPVVKACLMHNARFDIYNRYGGTALIPAAEKGHIEVVKLLANTPEFPIDHVNRLGWTALLEAVILGTGGKVHTEIVSELIKAGSNVNIADKDGVSSLQHARKRGFTQIESLLVKAGAK